MKYFFKKKKKEVVPLSKQIYVPQIRSSRFKFKESVSIVIYEVIPGDFTQSAPFHSTSAS